MSNLSIEDLNALANGRYITRVEDAEELLAKCDNLDLLRDYRYINNVIGNKQLEEFIKEQEGDEPGPGPEPKPEP